MKRVFILALLGISICACADDIPPASAKFRDQMVKEDAPACVQGIESHADLRAIYSHKTVQAYCTCRQQYRADVLEQALKTGERGKAVQDRAADYAQKKCVHILLNQLERE